MKISEDEYFELLDCYGGYCLNCEDLVWEGCEPDARNYLCPNCNHNKLFGIEEAMVMGEVDVV